MAGTQVEDLRKKLEKLPELRELVRKLGRSGGKGPKRRAPEEVLAVTLAAQATPALRPPSPGQAALPWAGGGSCVCTSALIVWHSDDHMTKRHKECTHSMA